jgi:hypothetical protein
MSLATATGRRRLERAKRKGRGVSWESVEDDRGGE